MEVTLNIKVPVNDLIEAAMDLEGDEISKMILEMDLYVADYDFTLGLIRSLVESLKKDVDGGALPFTAKDIGLE